MKNIFYFALGIVLLSSCQQSDKNAESVQPSAPTAMELVENNTYIDVPDFGIQAQSRSQEIDPVARKAMVNAALYRFYKHVEVIDSQYVCHLSGADEINVSPTTYNAMLNDLEKSNEFIRKENKLGHRVTIGSVDDDYLNSLLDDRPLQEKMQEQAAKIIQQEKQ